MNHFKNDKNTNNVARWGVSRCDEKDGTKGRKKE
jgi:hypothetical protein